MGKDALARGMHLVISEHYSRALAERTRDGLVKRFEQKAWTGGPPPYGYQIEVTEAGLHRLKVNEPEAAVVRWVFQVYTTESVGLKAIAHRLRERGIPARKCPVWTHTSVRAILTNNMAIGRITYNRLALHARPQARTGQLLAPAYRPFTGMIFCEVCGSVCYRRTSKNRKGEYHYYGCGRRQRNGPDTCRNAVERSTLFSNQTPRHGT
jgi:site-specific DNA recombinase